MGLIPNSFSSSECQPLLSFPSLVVWLFYSQVYDYGFRCVVSSFFADIFRNNCLNIGVLPVQVSAGFLQKIFSAIDSESDSKFTIDLPKQTITIDSSGEFENFKINSYKKDNMLNGFDDIDYLMNIKDQIGEFAKNTPL